MSTCINILIGFYNAIEKTYAEFNAKAMDVLDRVRVGYVDELHTPYCSYPQLAWLQKHVFLSNSTIWLSFLGILLIRRV